MAEPAPRTPGRAQFELATGVVVPMFTCPRCLAQTFHPEDVREGYCVVCHDWTADPPPGACGDPACPVLHADPVNPIHPPDYEAP